LTPRFGYGRREGKLDKPAPEGIISPKKTAIQSLELSRSDPAVSRRQPKKAPVKFRGKGERYLAQRTAPQ
jgi:hypothetical protein